jgi:hypothetical protein
VSGYYIAAFCLVAALVFGFAQHSQNKAASQDAALAKWKVYSTTVTTRYSLKAPGIETYWIEEQRTAGQPVVFWAHSTYKTGGYDLTMRANTFVEAERAIYEHAGLKTLEAAGAKS